MFVVSDLEGRGQEQLLTTVPGLGRLLVWSPDGIHAVVRGEDRELYLADTRAGSLGPCLSCGVEDAIGGVALSPDGRVVAFGADDGLYVTRGDGMRATRIAAVPFAGWVSWAPDGASMVFEGGNSWDLYHTDSEGRSLTQLTQSSTGSPASYFKPQWSPLGDRIAVHISDRDGLRLALMNPDGTGLTELAQWTMQTEILDPAAVPPPQWSPDGQQILFVSDGPMGDLEVFVVNADGTGLRNLTNFPGRDDDPVWSPDGRYIAFVTNRDGNDEIFVMNADGSDPRSLSHSPVIDECCPGWRP